MTRTATIIGGLVVAIAAAVVPPPQQLLAQHPKLLYGAAIVKAATGDANSALRLLQRSSEPAPQPVRLDRASTCTLSPRG